MISVEGWGLHPHLQPDGVLTCSAMAQVRLWEMRGEDSKVLRKLSGHSSHINSVLCSPDGVRVYTAGGTGQVPIAICCPSLHRCLAWDQCPPSGHRHMLEGRLTQSGLCGPAHPGLCRFTCQGHQHARAQQQMSAMHVRRTWGRYLNESTFSHVLEGVSQGCLCSGDCVAL